MGIYLNGTTAYTLYKSETVKPYFIDKTALLEQLFPLVNEGNNYICITRPRNDLPKRCKSYEEYIERIENRLMEGSV